MSSVRTDIQALRGVAVSLVLLDHFKLCPFTQGFLGVDIFFVISGVPDHRADFARDQRGPLLDRRILLAQGKRLLPAAYATILLTSVGSIWLLNSIEMAALTRQTIGALTYTINLVLWREVDYFGVAAGFKPPLHMWSLAIEEQFYLLFPILLIALPRRSWLKGVAVLGIASFGICIALSWKFPTATFYLLPTRVWELLMGAGGRAPRRVRCPPAWPFLGADPGIGDDCAARREEHGTASSGRRCPARLRRDPGRDPGQPTIPDCPGFR